MFRDLIARLRGRRADEVSQQDPAVESELVTTGKTEANAVEHLGGFDPETLIDDPGAPR